MRSEQEVHRKYREFSSCTDAYNQTFCAALAWVLGATVLTLDKDPANDEQVAELDYPNAH